MSILMLVKAIALECSVVNLSANHLTGIFLKHPVVEGKITHLWHGVVICIFLLG